MPSGAVAFFVEVVVADRALRLTPEAALESARGLEDAARDAIRFRRAGTR